MSNRPIIGFSGSNTSEELTSTVTFTADIPSRTFVVSSEVATMLLGSALIDMMRDKSFTADVPRLILSKTLLMLVSDPS